MEWINVKDKPIPSYGRFLVGLYVKNNKTNETKFDYYDLLFEEYEIRQVYEDMFDDYFSSWERGDFEYWTNIEEPKRNGYKCACCGKEINEEGVAIMHLGEHRYVCSSKCIVNYSK